MADATRPGAPRAVAAATAVAAPLSPAKPVRALRSELPKALDAVLQSSVIVGAGAPPSNTLYALELDVDATLAALWTNEPPAVPRNVGRQEEEALKRQRRLSDLEAKVAPLLQMLVNEREVIRAVMLLIIARLEGTADYMELAEARRAASGPAAPSALHEDYYAGFASVLIAAYRAAAVMRTPLVVPDVLPSEQVTRAAVMAGHLIADAGGASASVTVVVMRHLLGRIGEKRHTDRLARFASTTCPSATLWFDAVDVAATQIIAARWAALARMQAAADLNTSTVARPLKQLAEMVRLNTRQSLQQRAGALDALSCVGTMLLQDEPDGGAGFGNSVAVGELSRRLVAAVLGPTAGSGGSVVPADASSPSTVPATASPPEYTPLAVPLATTATPGPHPAPQVFVAPAAPIRKVTVRPAEAKRGGVLVVVGNDLATLRADVSRKLGFGVAELRFSGSEGLVDTDSFEFVSDGDVLLATTAAEERDLFSNRAYSAPASEEGASAAVPL